MASSGVIEPVSHNDSIGVFPKHNEFIKDNSVIHGYVTVIKNKDKPNEEVIQVDKPNVLTDVGRDALHNRMYVGLSANPPAFEFIAVSTGQINTGTDTADINENKDLTALPATEVGHADFDTITARPNAGGTHGADTNTSEISYTFTANKNITDIQSAALFDANAAGNMGHIANFSSAVTLSDDDTLTVTWTITVG